MAREAAAAAQQARQHKEEQQRAGGNTVAAAGGGGSQAQAGPGLALVGPGRPPRMKRVWMGCMENKGGFFPIRDPASKWCAPLACAQAGALSRASCPCPPICNILVACSAAALPPQPATCRYMSHEELPDSAVPFAVKYLAGWGVVLSRDLVQHAVAKANLYTRHPELAPPWFK